VSNVYAEPATEISFGDIFESSFLFDVHLRYDAVQLGSRTASLKHGGGLAYSATYAGDRQYVLGRGGPFRAILMTDNCAVDTALGQRLGSTDVEVPQAKPKGRLLFAPLTDAKPEEVETATFGRFPIPEEPEFRPAQIAELRRCFMVDSRDIAEHRNARIARLSEALADDLEVRWNAFAVRRGPLAAARNADKLVGLLARSRGHEDEPLEQEALAGQSIVDALVAVWRLEGGCLENVGNAFDRRLDGMDAVNELEANLEEASRLAKAALEAVRAVRA
jgi:hypothetical protein